MFWQAHRSAFGASFGLLVGGSLSVATAQVTSPAGAPVAQDISSLQPVPPASAPFERPASSLDVKTSTPVKVKWDVLAKSAEGRPIEFPHFGDGQRQSLVVGSFEGDQPEGVALADSLAAHLARYPQLLDDLCVTIVRDPNPDGRAKGKPTNSHGVAIDRNFLTSGWRKVAAGDGLASGRVPESEPESQALAALIADLKPDRVILLATSARQETLAWFGPAEKLARQVAIELNAKLISNDPADVPGSLVVMTGSDRGIPTLKFGIAPRASSSELWSTHRKALLTAVGCGTPSEFPLVSSQPRLRRVPGLVPIVPPEPAKPPIDPPAPTVAQVPAAEVKPIVPVVPPIATPRVADVFDPRVERLPSVNIFGPRRPSQASRLPQEPIPAYPETGK